MILKGTYPKYNVISKDSKAGKLESWYGDPLGPNKKNSELYRNENDQDFCDEVAKLFK